MRVRFACITIVFIFILSMISCESIKSDGQIRITIPRATEDGFQVELRLSRSNFDYSAVDSPGNNIRFFDQEENKLPYWIESWNPKAVSIVWVRVKNEGTNALLMRPAEPGSASESAGETVFDRADWNSFKNGWLFSGIISGRVAGWENPLTDYRLDTGRWNSIDISSRYAGAADHSRWFIRKELFLSRGVIGFSGNADNASVWTLVRSDEIYRKMAGDERDVDGKAKGAYSHSYNLEDGFGRYIWAGRGQILLGAPLLTIQSVDTGYANVYTRKLAGTSSGTSASKTAVFANSFFPGDPESLPDKSITRGWRAWPGSENFFIDRESGSPVLASPVLGEKQKLVMPVKGLTRNWKLKVDLSFQTPDSIDTLLDIDLGPIDFGIIYEGHDSYLAFVNSERGRIPSIRKDTIVRFDLKKEGENIELFLDNTRVAGAKFKEDEELVNAKSIEIQALNPRIHELSFTPATGKNTTIDHDTYFLEDFSGMREGAVFYGWKGIENFKIVSEADRIALVSLVDDREAALDISGVPFPDDFGFRIETGLPLGTMTQFLLKVRIGTVEFGMFSDKGTYSVTLGQMTKPATSAQAGKHISLMLRKRGGFFRLGVNGENIFENVQLFDFLIGRTIGITSVNSRLYQIYIEHME